MRYAFGVMIITSVLTGCQSLNRDRPRAQTPDELGVEAAQLARSELGPHRQIGEIEPFALIESPMPTGLAISHDRRVFVNFPRWGDPVQFTVAEYRDGQLVPFPSSQINQLDPAHVQGLVSVQSVVIDPQNRLWILDTGSVNFQPIKPGAAKLIGVDLNRNEIVQTITFPEDVALPTTYLNDVRFDLSRGEQGMAFITDSSDSGPNGIIVVDLASGQSWRRLNDHPSVKAEKNFLPTVEGRPLMARVPGQPEAYIQIGSDGIAVDPQQKVLYYCPLAGRRLYSVSLDALANRDLNEQQVAETVKDLGLRNFASDGLICDSRGRLYLTDYENNAIRRRDIDGSFQVIAQDPRMIWPDSLSIGTDGYLYFTVNQLNRQARFNNGQDRRQPPYAIFRVRIDGRPQITGEGRQARAPQGG